jgi:sugar/nucleoside kinase (ribokinase family)
MVGKHASLKEVTWANISARFGREKFAAKLDQASLVGFVNWTMIPYMSQVWEAILKELCPKLSGNRRKIFFDLADPEKRTNDDIRHALDLIGRFQQYFDVVLGLNEKEANEIGQVLGLTGATGDPDSLARLSREIAAELPIHTLVVHPTRFAIAVTAGTVSAAKGLYTSKPLITTGAGDHFNAGFCLGKLLGFADDLALLVGVTNSGHYVRTAQSPTIPQLVDQLRAWPNEW